MMDLNRLHRILDETTVQLRKGEILTTSNAGPVLITTLDMNPSVADARDDLELVDLEFLIVGVDKAHAETFRDELVAIMKTYPHQLRLAGGPSYIEVGGVIGDQGAAFQLFALGKVLGLWNVMTPATLGFTGEEAKRMAGNGFVMMAGYKVDRDAEGQ